jgi:hypothetical protein
LNANFQSLLLSNNKLKTLPSSIGLLTKLETLNVSGNQLKALPVALGGCIALKMLDASKNSITKVQRRLELCRKLESLNLQNNLHLRYPSNLIPRLRSLKEFKIGKSHTVGKPPHTSKIPVTVEFEDSKSPPNRKASKSTQVVYTDKLVDEELARDPKKTANVASQGDSGIMDLTAAVDGIQGGSSECVTALEPNQAVDSQFEDAME